MAADPRLRYNWCSTGLDPARQRGCGAAGRRDVARGRTKSSSGGRVSPYRLVVIAIALAAACRFASDEDARGVPLVRLLVTPDSLAFHGRAGATVLPDRYLTLDAATSVSGRWTASQDGNWFFLPETEGMLPSLLTVAPRPAGLAAGTYAASIWIVAGNDRVRVPVTLDVALDLNQSGSQIIGFGTVAEPVGRIGVTGTWTDPTVSLILSGATDTLRFNGSLLDDNALDGTLTRTGTGASSAALTLYRQ